MGVSIFPASVKPFQVVDPRELDQAIERGAGAVTDVFVGAHNAQERAARRQLIQRMLRDAARDELLAPLRLQVEQARLQGELEILPLRTQAERGQLQAVAEIQPIATRAARAGAQAQAYGAEAAAAELEKQQRYWEAALAQDPSGGLWRVFQLHRTLFPERPVPQREDGQIDFDQLRQETAPYLELARTPQAQVSEDLIKKALDAGVNPYTPEGQVRPTAQIAQDIARARRTQTQMEWLSKKRPTILQLDELATNADDVERLYQRAASLASQFIRRDPQTGQILSPDMPANVLGPLVGSLPGRALLALTSPQRKALQAQFQQFAADLTASKTRLLKGALSNKELAFIQQSVPQVTDPESVWADYLNRVLPELQKAAQRARIRAELAQRWGQLPELRVLSSEEEAEKLPEGTAYQLDIDPPTHFRIKGRPGLIEYSELITAAVDQDTIKEFETAEEAMRAGLPKGTPFRLKGDPTLYRVP